jgi:hypothetical protein
MRRRQTRACFRREAHCKKKGGYGIGGSLVKTFVVRVYCRFNGCIGRRDSIGDHESIGGGQGRSSGGN